MAEKKAPEYAPDGRPIWGRNSQGEPICNAPAHKCTNTDLTNGRCPDHQHRKPPAGANRINEDGAPICGIYVGKCQKTKGLRDNGRCHTHGGDNTGAPIKHGGRSKLYGKIGIGAMIEAARTDPGLIDHTENVLYIEGLIRLLGDSAQPNGDLWEKAIEVFPHVLAGEGAAIAAMGDLLKSGLDAAKTIERSLELLEIQRKHIDSQMRLQAIKQSSIDARELNAILVPLLTTLMTEFDVLRSQFGAPVDQSRHRVATEFKRLCGPEDLQPASRN